VRPFKLFKEILHARFLRRPNRFLVVCELDGLPVQAFLPNPGRLNELLLRDSTLYLTPAEQSPGRKTSFTVVAVERDDQPVMLHTHRTNDVARHMIEAGIVPGFERARIVRAEVKSGHSRFDFLLDHDGRQTYLEVKSVTLFGKRVAMFPDAVTARGARHLKELKALSEEGVGTAVIFVVHWPHAEVFMPDYHTDLNFARTFLDVRGHVPMLPLAVRWRRDLTLHEDVRLLDIPWDYIGREAEDRGSYLLILRLPAPALIPVGSLGEVYFKEGYYVYVGSAMANLGKRIERHMRQRKRHHWHIDELRARAEVTAVLAIRSSVRLECGIAKSMSAIADGAVRGFGSTDCSCASHLFFMERDPLGERPFQDLLQYFRMDRRATPEGCPPILTSD
jgi:sugar fermentation stimulation protein A